MTGGSDRSHVLFSTKQMYAADAGAIAAGVPGIDLMTAAGAAVTDVVRRNFPPCKTTVLCGPGNNGGDGFVAARLLADAGWPVRTALLGDREALNGDAAIAASQWPGSIERLDPDCVADAALVVDALFGAGLGRDIDGVARETLETVAARDIPVIAVDIPSGVHGDSGDVMGYAVPARHTVTFGPKKYGHCLLPGRTYCGTITVADIGIPESVIDAAGATVWENQPDVWRDHFPWPAPAGHKYDRGYAVVCSGGVETTGAARLAARAALRIGAGLVGVSCPPDALPVLAASLTAVMTKSVDGLDDFKAFIGDARRQAALIGPGSGVTSDTRDKTIALLNLGKRCVIDADALTVFGDDPTALFGALHPDCVLTPHEGEFKRIFGNLDGSRLERARAAASHCGAVVLLKGGDTIVAAPDGRATITTNAPPDLATAGAGDVLAGFILGLLSQRMPAFEAANAAAWLHGKAAARVGPGLIAEDITEQLPATLREIKL